MCFLGGCAFILNLDLHLDCRRTSDNHFFFSVVWHELENIILMEYILLLYFFLRHDIGKQTIICSEIRANKWKKQVNLEWPQLILCIFLPFCSSTPLGLSSSVYTPTCFPLQQCGFFQRAHYKDKLPQYHAVKIPREDRPQFQNEKSGVVNKKEWATHWSDGSS